MRYRLAILCLAAMLGVLPALNNAPAVPAPKQPQRPAIYALIYVGLGKNDRGNADRIDSVLKSMPGSAQSAVFAEPDARVLAIVKDKKRELGVDKWIEWAQSKTHAANLEGTAVVRVWFTDGSQEDKVVLANAIARNYVEGQQERFRGALKALQGEKADYKARQERAGAKYTEEDERVFRRREEAIKHLPHVIEWATLPEKP